MMTLIIILIFLIPVAYILGKLSQWEKDARNTMGGDWHHRHHGK